MVLFSIKETNFAPMSQGFYPIRISEIIAETADAKTLVLDIPAELTEVFQYSAGQYLTFEAEINGENVRRSYSLCTYQGTDKSPAVTVKKVPEGRMSTYFNESLKAGDTLQVMPPMGKFTVVPQTNHQKHYVLFGGGSGITPVMGIAKAILSDEPLSKVTLIYANKDPESVIFKEKIKSLENQYSGRFTVHLSFDKAPFTWFGLKGQLTEEKVQNIIKNKIGGPFDTYPYYICGPGPMMEVIKNGLRSVGVPSDFIHIEYFSAPTGNKESVVVGAPSESESFSGTAELTLSVYGKTHTLTVDENTSILDAAIKNGIDPPYSCTVGVCTTCRAKVREGKVHMLEREGLSDQEIKDGFVLTCQSLPRSNKIVLSYE
jgi:ring-1,2-phenylacetyl-CoA epoxidase subunit PaaE